MSNPPSPSPMISALDQMKLLDKLEVFQIQGQDTRGRMVLRIVGKHFPAREVSSETLKRYLEEKIFPGLAVGERPLSVVYLHTGVQRGDNFPGVSALRSIYDAIPGNIKDHLEAVYFVHPGVQARLFFATFGRFLFSGGLYWKVKYVHRVEFLWDKVRKNEMEIPEFVYDHDKELEYRPMELGLESDYPRFYGAPFMDSSVSLYSMRCIA